MPAPRDSGLDPPPAAPTSFVEADVTLDSGLDPPPGGDAVQAPAGASAEGAGPAAARAVGKGTPPEKAGAAAKARHAATVRVAIQDPHPFSIQLQSDETIEVVSVEVSILANGRPVFNTALGIGSPMTLTPGQPRTLVLTSAQLAGAQADLKVGNVVQVKVIYLTPPQPAQIRLSIVGEQ